MEIQRVMTPSTTWTWTKTSIIKPLDQLEKFYNIMMMIKSFQSMALVHNGMARLAIALRWMIKKMLKSMASKAFLKYIWRYFRKFSFLDRQISQKLSIISKHTADKNRFLNKIKNITFCLFLPMGPYQTFKRQQILLWKVRAFPCQSWLLASAITILKKWFSLMAMKTHFTLKSTKNTQREILSNSFHLMILSILWMTWREKF